MKNWNGEHQRKHDLIRFGFSVTHNSQGHMDKSSFGGKGRPLVPLWVLLQSRAATLVEPQTGRINRSENEWCRFVILLSAELINLELSWINEWSDYSNRLVLKIKIFLIKKFNTKQNFCLDNVVFFYPRDFHKTKFCSKICI